MRDLYEMALQVETDYGELPKRKKKEILCDLLLEELKSLKGRELAPYLSELVFDMVEPGTRIVLKFPVGSYIFDTMQSKFKDDRA